jgi:hypothetical protein
MPNAQHPTSNDQDRNTTRDSKKSSPVRAKDELQMGDRLTCERSFGGVRFVATQFANAMVTNERDTSFVHADWFCVRQRDGSRAKCYAITISIARCVGVAGVNAHTIRLTTLGPKRGRGALEDLPHRRSLQPLARSNREGFR